MKTIRTYFGQQHEWNTKQANDIQSSQMKYKAVKWNEIRSNEMKKTTRMYFGQQHEWNTKQPNEMKSCRQLKYTDADRIATRPNVIQVGQLKLELDNRISSYSNEIYRENIDPDTLPYSAPKTDPIYSCATDLIPHSCALKCRSWPTMS